jgi:hypothetical protein
MRKNIQELFPPEQLGHVISMNIEGVINRKQSKILYGYLARYNAYILEPNNENLLNFLCFCSAHDEIKHIVHDIIEKTK